jgi:hypothetical protein
LKSKKMASKMAEKKLRPSSCSAGNAREKDPTAVITGSFEDARRDLQAKGKAAFDAPKTK